MVHMHISTVHNFFYIPPSQVSMKTFQTCSVADPDPVGSASFCRIRMRIPIRIRIDQNKKSDMDPDRHQIDADGQHCKHVLTVRGLK